jgi:molybdopterin synthase catalytic subunit
VRVQVLFFGMLKDVLGRASDTLELAEGGRLADVFAHYAARQPRLHELAPSIVLARNHEFADRDTTLSDGDEVAFLPPVSGGMDSFSHTISEDGNFYALTRAPIGARGIVDRILRGDDGAFVDFEGVVRNNTKGRRTRYLDY